MATPDTPLPWRLQKCRCGHPACRQFSFGNSGINGLYEEDADYAIDAINTRSVWLVEHYTQPLESQTIAIYRSEELAKAHADRENKRTDSVNFQAVEYTLDDAAPLRPPINEGLD